MENQSLTAATVRDGDTFAGLRGEWDALLDESEAGLFNAWEWLYPWYRRISRGVSPRILTLRDEEGHLRGLLAAGVSTRWAGPLQIRRLSFLGESYVGSDYLGPVARRGSESDVARRMARALGEASAEWDVLDFLDLDAHAPFLEALREQFPQPTWTVEVRPRFLCPFDRLPPGAPFEQYLRQTARRDNYLRRRKWLAQQAGFTIEKETRPEALTLPVAEFLRLHAMRWQEDGGSQGIRGSSVEAFHRDATALLAERGQLRFYTLRIGGNALASVYGLRHKERFWYFQSGYDPAWRDKSVGLVLVGETFRDAIAEGCLEYDFLRGTESYKADWVSQRRSTVSVRVHRRGGIGRCLTLHEEGGRRLREASKALLPGPWVERVRRWRRARSRRMTTLSH